MALFLLMKDSVGGSLTVALCSCGCYIGRNVCECLASFEHHQLVVRCAQRTSKALASCIAWQSMLCCCTAYSIIHNAQLSCSLSGVSFFRRIYECTAALQRWLVCRTDGLLLAACVLATNAKLSALASMQSKCVVGPAWRTDFLCMQPHVPQSDCAAYFVPA